MTGKKSNARNPYPLRPPVPADPYPALPVEHGPKKQGVGEWVPQEKHRLLWHYLDASKNAWRRWPNRIFIDPFSGPGRIQVKHESFTRPSGVALAHLALSLDAPFTAMLVGDLDTERAAACEMRLKAIGAAATAFPGPALTTVPKMVASVPSNSLCMAYIDPYSLEHLSFSILKELAKLRKIDLAVNFSTMDLQRNVELEFDPTRDRFDEAAPAWSQDSAIRAASRQNVKHEFFRYWLNLVQGLGFTHSHQMPTIHNTQGHGIYRLCFFSKHGFPQKKSGTMSRVDQTSRSRCLTTDKAMATSVDEKIAQLRAGWRDLQPLTRGFYTNMADSYTTLAGFRENYGANLERLVALKAKYDPMNLFRLNANVPPKI